MPQDRGSLRLYEEIMRQNGGISRQDPETMSRNAAMLRLHAAELKGYRDALRH